MGERKTYSFYCNGRNLERLRQLVRAAENMNEQELLMTIKYALDLNTVRARHERIKTLEAEIEQLKGGAEA